MMDTKVSEAEFREKFIGYVNVLGFKNLVKSTEAGNGMSLPAVILAPREIASAKLTQIHGK